MPRGLTQIVGAALALFAAMSGAAAAKSRCYGETHHGRIEGAARPPAIGANYRAYCLACVAAGRTYGHDRVIAAMRRAYGALAERRPETVFVYGEIGFEKGGPFWPHKTHQNGLSVDFMVPLTPETTPGGRPPTRAANRYGYDLEFDRDGRLIGGEAPKRLWPGAQKRIDFDAIAAHLLALEAAARAEGGLLRRVILAPDLQDDLRRAEGGAELFRRVVFSKRPSWVRHDDHYHVDFDFPCQP